MTNVLLIYDSFIPTVRLCAYEQLNYLANKGLLYFEHCNAREVTGKQCSKADVVIFVRSSTVLELSLAKKCKKKNKFLIYILDDDLLNIAPDLHSTPYYSMENIKNRMKKILNLCDVLASPSSRLLHKYEKYIISKTILIEEPCKMYSNKRVENEKIKIGFAGSPDHNRDLNSMLNNVIHTIYNKYNDIVVIEFFGAKPKIVDDLNLKYYSYTNNYEEYQKKLIELNWDVGLAPLADTEFNKCKHYNKYIEYGSIGCVGVYSNIEPYTKVIKNGINGYLCDNIEEIWFQSLETIILNKKVLGEISGNVMKEISQNFTIPSVAENLIIDLPDLIEYKAPINRCFFVKGIKTYSIFIRGLEYLKRNGMKTPITLFEKLKIK